MRCKTLVALVTVFAMVVPAAPAFAAIRITKVYVNSPGSDTGSNKSLNNEYITLKNTGSKARRLTGWTIRDSGADHSYRFGTYRLRAGRRVTIHTGRGADTRRHRYWDMDWYVWNNDGDRARLRKRSGVLVDGCRWGTVTSYTRC